ncbi:MAG: metallophosphoesterase [Eubacteriales bacterium]|nr:metallophosphoesterase [Eubacteriales bacterium]
MLMWMLIFAGMFLAMLAGIIYLISRVYRTELAKTISKGNKHVQRILAFAVIAICVGICYLGLGMINTAIVVVHALLVWIVIDLIAWIIKKKSSKTMKYDWVMLAGILILGVYFGWGWHQAHHVVRTAYEVNTDKKVKNLKVVQITDSHVGATFDGEGFAEEVEKIQKENPDLVVVTGDFVDDDTSREDMVRASEALGTLQTTYGVYFVFGNHDKGYNNGARGYDAEKLIRELQKNNVTVLQDETVLIGEEYYLIGRQDRSEENLGGSRATMEELVEDLEKDKFMIVLDHQPNDYDAQEKSKVDLVLSGHTHGGQFWPINYLGEWTGQNDMTYGIRQKGDTTFEVSSGISDWAIKFKTGCKSEYVVIDIQPNN